MNSSNEAENLALALYIMLQNNHKPLLGIWATETA